MIVVTPFVVAVLFVVAGRRRASQQGTVFPMRRAVLAVGADAVVAAPVAIVLGV